MNKRLVQSVILVGLVLAVMVIMERQPVKTVPEDEIKGVISEAVEEMPEMASVASPSGILAKAVVVWDVTNHRLVWSRNEKVKLMPASTTKIMTALVALKEYDSHEIATVTRATEAIGSTVDFVPGEQLIVRDLIKAMLISSGNDAAVSLADHHNLGYVGFVNLMNNTAREFGLTDSHFSNVAGMEAPDHYMSATDLARLTDIAMSNSDFREAVASQSALIRSIDGKYTHLLESTNELIGKVPGLIGVKTGWTDLAGECLVTYVSRDYDIITVVLKSTDRFGDSKRLIEWYFDKLSWGR